MSLVHHQPGMMALLDVDQARQVGIVPVHAIEAFDHDHHTLVLRADLGQEIVQVIEIIVLETQPRAACEFGTHDRAVVHDRVMYHQVLRAQHLANHAEIGGVSADEDAAILDAIMARQPKLQVAMDLALARDMPARPARNPEA
jgi:hypothetical protein